MLSAKSLFQEILDNDESFRLFCSIAASGESQGGWENGRIAALVPESQRALAPKITRHGADEDKHGRIFNALLKKRGLRPVEVPPETDYTMLLEQHGIGLAHEQAASATNRSPSRTSSSYLAHSRVTEQRASEQMALLRQVLRRPPRPRQRGEDDLATTRTTISPTATRSCCASPGPDTAARSSASCGECALAEIRVYRDVSLAVMDHMGRILGWPSAKAAVLAAGDPRHVRVRTPRRLAAHGQPGTARAARRAGRPAGPGARVRLSRAVRAVRPRRGFCRRLRASRGA